MVHNKKPYITVRGNKTKTCLLIDTALSEDWNMIKKSKTS
jgi:hypothetical protein